MLPSLAGSVAQAPTVIWFVDFRPTSLQFSAAAKQRGGGIHYCIIFILPDDSSEVVLIRQRCSNRVPLLNPYRKRKLPWPL